MWVYGAHALLAFTVLVFLELRTIIMMTYCTRLTLCHVPIGGDNQKWYCFYIIISEKQNFKFQSTRWRCDSFVLVIGCVFVCLSQGIDLTWTYTHTHTHTHTSACAHTCTHTYTHTCARTPTHTLTHSETRTHAHTYTHTHSLILRHTQAHARTHTYTHTLTHSEIWDRMVESVVYCLSVFFSYRYR